MDNLFWGTQLFSTCQWRSQPPLSSSAARSKMKFFSENHSGM